MLRNQLSRAGPDATDGVKMGKKRRSKALAGVALLPGMLTANTVAAPPAPAATACIGGSSNLFDGHYGGGTTMTYGASALITVRSGSWCLGIADSVSFYSGWSMLAAPSGGGHEYAQSGFNHDEDKSRIHFAQANTGSGFDSNFNGGTALVGSTYKYWSVADSNCDCLRMFVNSTQLLQTTWSPWDEWSKSSAWQPQFFGEVRDAGDDMPGTNSYKTVFDELKVHDGGAWTTDLPPMDSLNSNSTRWGQTDVITFCSAGPRCFGIWTK